MRMSRSSAVLLLSLSADTVSSEVEAAQPIASAAESILGTLIDHDIAATWGQRSPVDSPLASTVGRTHLRQSLALLLPAQGGQAMAEHLRREALRSRAAGIPLSTVFAAGTLASDYYHLLVKYGVTAIYLADGNMPRPRPASSARASRWLLPLVARASEMPQKLRWGLWRMPRAVSLAREGAWPVRHAIDRAVAAGDMIHVHIDLAMITDRRRRLMDDAESVIRQIASYAGQGRLQTQTLGAAAAALTNPRKRPGLLDLAQTGRLERRPEEAVSFASHAFSPTGE